MNIVVAIYLFGLALWIILMMLRHHRSGACELLSIRNFALIGFIIFQLTSAAVPLLLGNFGHFHINEVVKTSLIYALMATCFTVIMLWSYRGGWGCRTVLNKMPLPRTIPSDTSLIMIAFILSILALTLRFAVQIHLISIISSYIGVGLASVSAALVAWVWARRFFNPLIAAISLFIIAVSLANVVSGAFGRRGIVAIGAAVLWGMYYSHWRYIPATALVRKIAFMSIVPIVVLALFSSGRTSAEKDRTVQEQVKAMLSADIKEGLILLLDGQGCGTISMWIVENYPEPFEYRNLLTLRYFFAVDVPRAWWPNKPFPLSNYIASEAAIPGVNKTIGSHSGGGPAGISMGPGIIGHAVADGGWPVLILYSVLFGLFLRFFDEMMVVAAHSPFVVLPVGSALGQIVGLARGETSVFANIYVIAVFGCIIIMVILNQFFGKLAGTQELEVIEEEEYYDYEDE